MKYDDIKHMLIYHIYIICWNWNLHHVERNIRPSRLASHNFLGVVQEGWYHWYLFLLPSLPPALGKSTWHIGDSELKWLHISQDLQTNKSLFSRQSKEGTELHMETMTRQSGKSVANAVCSQGSKSQKRKSYSQNYHARGAILQLGGYINPYIFSITNRLSSPVNIRS